MEEILRLFPDEMRQAIQSKIGNRWLLLQEIRIRLNQPIELAFDSSVEWIAVKPEKKDGLHIINQLSEFSLYRMTDELREGYITIEGGHRVGIAGRVNTIGGSVKALQYITFFNIRVAKQKIGAAIPILPYMYHQGKYLNTLLVGAPQTGKTTIIRDATRLIASGWKKVQARKVGVIDERSEIAASINGIPQHDLGHRTDVMDACPKAEGMMMMIRSMSPDVLVVDEIGGRDDIAALMEAVNTGVTVICTIHGQDLLELKKRPSLKPLFEQKVFSRIIILEKSQTPAKVKTIFDQDEIEIFGKTRFIMS